MADSKGSQMENSAILRAVAVCLLLGMWPHPAEGKEQILPRDRPVLERPAIRIGPADVAPVIDGKLDEACWKEAVTVPIVTLCYQGEYAAFETKAFLCYDEAAVYVGFECWEIPGGCPLSLSSAASGTAEVLIDAMALERYYKLAMDTGSGVTTQQWGGGSAEWLRQPVAAAVGEDPWTVEFAIPFDALALASPVDSGRWRINLGRRRPDRMSNVAWATTYAWFYEPQFFGDVFFVSSEAVRARISTVGPPRVSDTPLSVELRNPGTEPSECEILLSLERRDGVVTVAREIVTMDPGKVKEVPMDFSFHDGMLAVATVSVFEGHLPEPILRQSFPVNLPANRAVLGEVRGRLAVLERELPVEADDILSPLAGRCAAFERALEEAESSASAWKALAKPIERLKGEVEKFFWQLQHDALQERFALGVADSLDKLKRDSAYQGGRAEVVSLSGARGEYECFQVVIIPGNEDLEEVEVTATALKGPEGVEIPAGNVEVQWEGFVETRQPRHPADYLGYEADPLFPMDHVSRVVLSEALHQPFWVSVHIPRDAPAGIYRGALEVSGANASPQSLEVRVRVYDFGLPERPELKTAFWVNEGLIAQWYGWEEIPQDIRRSQMAFLLKYGISPAIGWNLLEPRSNFDFALQGGLNTVQLGNVSQWPPSDEILAKINAGMPCSRSAACSIWPTFMQKMNQTRASTRRCGTPWKKWASIFQGSGGFARLFRRLWVLKGWLTHG